MNIPAVTIPAPLQATSAMQDAHERLGYMEAPGSKWERSYISTQPRQYAARYSVPSERMSFPLGSDVTHDEAYREANRLSQTVFPGMTTAVFTTPTGFAIGGESLAAGDPDNGEISPTNRYDEAEHPARAVRTDSRLQALFVSDDRSAGVMADFSHNPPMHGGMLGNNVDMAQFEQAPDAYRAPAFPLPIEPSGQLPAPNAKHTVPPIATLTDKNGHAERVYLTESSTTYRFGRGSADDAIRSAALRAQQDNYATAVVRDPADGAYWIAHVRGDAEGEFSPGDGNTYYDDVPSMVTIDKGDKSLSKAAPQLVALVDRERMIRV